MTSVERIQLQSTFQASNVSRQPGYHVVTFQTKQNQPVPMAYPGKSKKKKDDKKGTEVITLVSSPCAHERQHPISSTPRELKTKRKRKESCRKSSSNAPGGLRSSHWGLARTRDIRLRIRDHGRGVHISSDRLEKKATKERLAVVGGEKPTTAANSHCMRHLLLDANVSVLRFGSD
jgi:hypothetical protein